MDTEIIGHCDLLFTFNSVLDFALQPHPGHEPLGQYNSMEANPLRHFWSKYE